MNECAVPLGVSAIAVAIAEQIASEEDLILLAAILNQISSTLETIAAQRDKVKKSTNIDIR